MNQVEDEERERVGARRSPSPGMQVQLVVVGVVVVGVVVVVVGGGGGGCVVFVYCCCCLSLKFNSCRASSG